MHAGPLYRRYDVVARDGKPIDADTFLFVLNPKTDPYAVVAMVAYVKACHVRYPELAADMIKTYRLPCDEKGTMPDE